MCLSASPRDVLSVIFVDAGRRGILSIADVEGRYLLSNMQSLFSNIPVSWTSRRLKGYVVSRARDLTLMTQISHAPCPAPGLPILCGSVQDRNNLLLPTDASNLSKVIRC
jgi:hypothetical protein